MFVKKLLIIHIIIIQPGIYTAAADATTTSVVAVTLFDSAIVVGKFQIRSNAKPDIEVGGRLGFYRYFSSIFFRQLPSELAERN